MLPMAPTIDIAGEDALIIYFSDQVSKDTSTKIQHVQHAIRQLMQASTTADIIDIIPSYASILVVFNLVKTDYFQVRRQLQLLIDNLDVNEKKVDENNEAENNKITFCSTVELPVYYSTESGPDLAAIAQRNKLSIEQVIQLHQAKEYQVYAIGFAPGFAYLGDVDERIASPRLSTPRLKVPKGAVAIADKQTAVYPNTSPGGWNIIGLCPVDMFDQKATPHMPIKVGDNIRFKAISRNEYLSLGGQLPNELATKS